eukprot:NODE_5328_length_592_cov_195.765363.p2 GENE.NODE_5328_length_592_cov_195.765363~~NODE_5328_length_592_cov_195.765363.p2  ORF type:complete len:103 (-),score=18.76 NODE_5328_length_592_cov_195.765363:267-551(-)
MFSVTVGQQIEKTVCLNTSCGSINLVHTDPEQLEKDYRQLHEICGKGIFRVEGQTTGFGGHTTTSPALEVPPPLRWSASAGSTAPDLSTQTHTT